MRTKISLCFSPTECHKAKRRRKREVAERAEANEGTTSRTTLLS